MPTCPLYMVHEHTQTETDLIFILIRGSSLLSEEPKTRCEYLIKAAISNILLLFLGLFLL